MTIIRWSVVVVGGAALAACGGDGGLSSNPDGTAGAADLGAAADLVKSSCDDGVRNGGESDVDCGGGSCPRCGVGRMCRGAGDCGTGVCRQDVCVEASCTDGVVNGSETDVDCGGACEGCGGGRACRAGPDCGSGVCAAGRCAVPSCDDQLRNGDESDVDCGGPSCPGCPVGAACVGDDDCDRTLCTAARCRPAASCKRLHDQRPRLQSGIHPVDPDGDGAVGSLDVMCDMIGDGGGWTRVFNHHIAAGYFAGNADALSSNEGDPEAGKYSILKHLALFSRAGVFLFRIDWPGYEKRNVWSQTSNPTADVDVAGYVPLDIQSATNVWGGLERSSGTHGPVSNAAFIDGSVNHPHWYYAIGSFARWGNPGGIPAADSVAGPGRSVEQVQLWVK